ncbi:hypothetical protein [Pelagibacterium sp.]|uniref:hypothetical protein n=1 Tax=Pelagibacterium sp. TaxID=1967288 RepID=UPI003A95610B
MDDQTRILDRVNKTATEARSAAFAAQRQTDPEAYGEMIAAMLDRHLYESFNRLVKVTTILHEQTNHTRDVLEKAEEDKWAILQDVRNRDGEAERLKLRLPWFALGAAALTLVLTVALPRFLASNGVACAVLGAEWTATTSGINACVFYQR